MLNTWLSRHGEMSLQVYAAEKVLVSSGAYHNSCFTCNCCSKCLDVKNVYEGCGEIYCKRKLCKYRKNALFKQFGLFQNVTTTSLAFSITVLGDLIAKLATGNAIHLYCFQIKITTLNFFAFVYSKVRFVVDGPNWTHSNRNLVCILVLIEIDQFGFLDILFKTFR